MVDSRNKPYADDIATVYKMIDILYRLPGNGRVIHGLVMKRQERIDKLGQQTSRYNAFEVVVNQPRSKTSNGTSSSCSSSLSNYICNFLLALPPPSEAGIGPASAPPPSQQSSSKLRPKKR